jgi:hypothetical protein
MRTFHLRPPNVATVQGFTTDGRFIERFKKRIRFMINVANSTWDNQGTGKTSHVQAMGYTQWIPDFDLARVTLAKHMIGPLLRNDLSDSQRLVMQYQTTKTVRRKNLFCDWKLKSQPDSSRVRRKFIILLDLSFIPYSNLE